MTRRGRLHTALARLGAVWAAGLNTVLATRDRFGRRVVILELGKWDPAKIPTVQFFSSCFVLLEALTMV